MNKRLISVFLFAFVVSAGASLLLYRLISSRLTANAKQPSSQVVVASRTLAVGTLIRDFDVRIVDWSGPAPMQALKNPQDAIGRGVVETVYEGEPLLEHRLAQRGAGAGLAATIPDGMRAVAVRVNEVVGVAGFVVPGMRVDILILGTPPGGSPRLGTLTKTLLQNIEVLSAGQQIEKNNEGKPIPVQVVNLLVTPEQAEILSLASNDARIQLVLRNPLDQKEAKTSGTAMASLFSGTKVKLPNGTEEAPPPKPKRPAVVPVRQPAPVAAPKPPAPVPIVVEVIHGVRRAETKFSEKGEEKTEVKQ